MLLIFKRFDKNNKQIFYYINHKKILDTDIEYSMNEYKTFYNDLIYKLSQHHNNIIKQCDMNNKANDLILNKIKFENEINSIDENNYILKINKYYDYEKKLMK